ncbi:MAG: nucleotidyl transferase AbiEii/AbiGii toxin family protein [Fibrobacteria bacterium]|nr:nucleotidyl transferase AbiEii/AbiGii toxin family protein [Fibrobacteria bacterium]
MAKKEIKNMGESVRNRLLNIAKEQNRNFNAVLLQYAQERLLYRLSESAYKEKFVLKGGLLFLAYQMPSQRPTKDIDFLGRAVKNDKRNIQDIFVNVCSIDSKDGVQFKHETIAVKSIKEDAEYEGLRVNIPAIIAGAKLNLQIDVGFGDVQAVRPVKKDFPGLLSFPSPKLYMYRPESVVAEKFEAMVTRGTLNSRMKDYYDIFFLAQSWDFKQNTLREAIIKTFKNREVEIRKCEEVFTPEYVNNEEINDRWNNFLNRMNFDIEMDFKAVMKKIKLFLQPVIKFGEGTKVWDREKWKWI